jgi:demethylmenaquinone methyltransferase/2-methoxy-6-polyprenyl-1,4-benzoquinol methylase
MSQPEAERMVQVYRKLAGRYDVLSNRLYLVGQRTMRYKHIAVEQLAVAPGATIVDIGCGTGHNLPALSAAVGPTGRVIGVDLTDAMLARAADRVRRHGLGNVTLVEADLSDYEFPQDVDGIIACFSLTLISDFTKIIERGFQALAPAGRFVIVDYKLPGWWPGFLVPAIGPMIKPFGGDLSMIERKPFAVLERVSAAFRIMRRYGGWVYIATGVTKRTAKTMD